MVETGMLSADVESFKVQMKRLRVKPGDVVVVRAELDYAAQLALRGAFEAWLAENPRHTKHGTLVLIMDAVSEITALDEVAMKGYGWVRAP